MHNIQYSLLLSTLAGCLMVLGFAPFYVYAIPILAIALLLHLWTQADTPGHAAWLGGCFGLGMYAFGLYWLVGTLHAYVEMPLWLSVIVTVLVCVFMTSFTAATLWLAKRLNDIWLIPLLWGLSDWLRAWICSGFPWLVLGYSQAPASPLAGYLPVCGVYALTMVIVALAVLLYKVIAAKQIKNASAKKYYLAMVMLVCVGAVLSRLPWTHVLGTPVKVALLQGNVDQHIKWSAENSKRIVIDYLDMIRHVDAQLVILPETAFPVYISQVMGKTREVLLAFAQEKHANILIGMMDWSSSDAGVQKFNSAVNFGVSGIQVHHKTHLVPFGEFVPLKSLIEPLYVLLFHVPHSDFNVGEHKQLFEFQGLYAAVSICYEEMFGEEVAQVSASANMLISMSNGAWFGNTLALPQYLQFSQARAIENRKTLLRASNNGLTAVIDRWGHVSENLPVNRALVLTAHVQPYEGYTLYSKVRNGIFWVILTLGLAITCRRLCNCKKKFT